MRAKPDPTDVEALARPDDLTVDDRETEVSTQWVKLNPAWWADHLSTRSLPGGPLRVQTAPERGSFLTRRDVWQLAEKVPTDDEAVLALLWHALAWGAGYKVRNETRRMDSVQADPERAVGLLREAAALASTAPAAAYQLLHPRGIGAIGRLGPAFGTKFLYFAGGGRPEHPALILDARVATRLNTLGWSSLPTRGGWSASAYARYCDLAARWARELRDRSGQPVAADQIEKWLFRR